MLTQIRCDRFLDEYKIINFNAGLNAVLGSTGGNNAIGKTTFLQIIDYAFGGEEYSKSYLRDIKTHVGDHTIFFTFEFPEQPPLYFYRVASNPAKVFQCDKAGHLIEEFDLHTYREKLFAEYAIGIANLKFDEICAHFFRIYGRENTLEQYPLQVTPKEAHDKAVDFLMLLFGGNAILTQLKLMEEQLGVKASHLWMRQRPQVDMDKYEANEKTIHSLEARLEELMHDNEEVQMSFFGFDEQSREKINAAQKELRSLLSRRNFLQSQVRMLSENISVKKQDSEDDFQELLQYFPDANMKAFKDISSFHIKIRQILNDQLRQEIERLSPIIESCERDIARLKEKIKTTGVAKSMSSQIIAQCVQISKTIDRLKEKNDEIIRLKEQQEARTLAERKLQDLFTQQKNMLTDMVTTINIAMQRINGIVTDNKEKAPTLAISDSKDISFGTQGNTSEGTAFKSLVVYDLSILNLCPIPALIHDSNILKRISDIHLEHILEQYIASKKQVFIAFDKANSTTAVAHDILEETAIIRLSDGKELFGKSWSKIESTEQK